MERYQVLNRVLTPIDRVVDHGVDALKRFGVYDDVKEWVTGGIRAYLRSSFESNHQLDVQGQENIPTDGGCLVAANHQSWLDAQVLAVATKDRLHFVAKADFGDWPMLRHLLDLTDSILIRRGGDNDGLKRIEEAVLGGERVVIFPEGTIPGEEDVPRWEVDTTTRLLRGHTGAVRIAIATGRPVIPCGVSGTGRAFPPEAYPRFEIWPPLPRSMPISVRFGKPLYFQAPEGPMTREFLAAETNRLMMAISALVDHDRDVPDRGAAGCGVVSTYRPTMAYARFHKPTRNQGKAPLGVLVLHGFTSHIHCVDRLVTPLDEAGLPYRFPILRGHGTRYQDMAGVKACDWYEDGESALFDLLAEVEKVVVVGLSMGGLVALELAARHRDRIAGVVTVAAALKFQDPLAVLTPLMAKVIRFWPSPNAYHDEELRKIEDRNYPKFATDAFASLWEYSRHVTRQLSFVKAPILVLHSHQDQVIAPRAAQIIYAKVSSRDRTLTWFEKSGHEMLLDLERDAVQEAIMQFIRHVAGQ